MRKAVRVTLETGNLWSFKGLMGGEGAVRKTGTITSKAARNWGSMGGERGLGGVWGGRWRQRAGGKVGKEEGGVAEAPVVWALLSRSSPSMAALLCTYLGRQDRACFLS